ncbi:IS21 family transposase [Paraflavisolibacter sp. H34]|uniref:IS21 family transposase n=1 Tax=Huijunlia imazamoxiresistens TaxID=3127457 RepID=UPI003015F703
MTQIRRIIQLLHKGCAHRRIARELKLSRNTVKQYADRLLDSKHSCEQLQAMDDEALSLIVYAESKQKQSDPRQEDFQRRLPYFTQELHRTGVTRLLLWQEYRRSYPSGYGYTQFCQYLGQYSKVQNATMRFSYRPAEVMQVDFAGDLMHYVDRDTGELVPCPVFVAVLPYSGYSYVVALCDAKQPRVIKALNECLQYFGGVPQGLKTDNMKQLVSKSCRYEPVFTETFQQWALHNNIGLDATRVGKPKDKALVENAVKLTYQRIYAPLRDRVFFSLAELNGAIREQLAIHHSLWFQRKDYSRQDQFLQEEKPLLAPLPSEPYVLRHCTQAKVQQSYHILLGEDWHNYSVPFRYIGKTVNVVYDTEVVEIYHEHKRIALHTRSYKKHGITTLKEHMPQNHLHQWEKKGWDREYFVGEAEKIGPNCVLFMQGLLNSRQFTEQVYKSCEGLLRLAAAYTAVRLEGACKRALQGHNFSFRTVKNILLNNLDREQTPKQSYSFTMPAHDNLRGPQAYL